MGAVSIFSRFFRNGLRAARRFAGDERGSTAIEYGLITSLIFLAIVAALREYANATSDMYSEISSNLIE